MSIDYARTRRQFGQPIANCQRVRGKVADMYVWTKSARVMTYQALRAANHLEGSSSATSC